MAADRKHGDRPAEPHAFWSGTITFGLVSVPVDLYPTVYPRRTSLRTFGADGEPLKRRYVCSKDGRELDPEDIVRGYEWDDGRFTLVTDEELEALAPRQSRDIELQRFVGRDEIPLALLDRSYVLAPSGESTKAYHLLAITMEQKRLAGIASFVMRGREHLAAIFATGGMLRAATLRFATELRTPQEVGLPAAPSIAAKERRAFERLLDELPSADDPDLSLLEDETGNKLRELAERKAAAGDDVIEVADAETRESGESAEIIDIMSVLKRRMGAREKRQ